MSIIGNAKWLWKNEQKGILWGFVIGATLVLLLEHYNITKNYIKKKA